MSDFHKYPELCDVTLNDRFWTPYLDGFRRITVPHCFDNFEKSGYVENFISVAANDKREHIGPTFTDGLFYEMITGVSNLLIADFDVELANKLDGYIDIILKAQEADGYICTVVSQNYPHQKWGENGGDIIIQHDLYNQGALVEAAVAHYKATGSTKLLTAAVRCANNICSYIGKPPKHNVIPGHSMPEMAFIKLYRLFRDDRSLDQLARECNVDLSQYLEIVRFWYDNRGNHEARNMSPRYSPEYNQDTASLASTRTAMGHAVRAGLCYQGATAARIELERNDYETALLSIWRDIVSKKMHISGGIGARADIEGFDSEYQLPNNAYLETCAGIALAFFAAEMNLLSRNSEYFDIFELSLYNNILGAMASDRIRFYYDNPLVNDGTKNRWVWHGCPCCPPMLLKCFSSLSSYVYSYNEREICVNMYIGSSMKGKDFAIEQSDNTVKLSTRSAKTLLLRIPAYAQSFALLVNGEKHSAVQENGYAALDLNAGEWEIEVSFTSRLAEICLNPTVEDNRGCVCVMYGPYLYCAEGVDNGGDVSFTLAENPQFTVKDSTIHALTANGGSATLIPYYLRNNRTSDAVEDSKMAVWFKKENVKSADLIAEITKDHLYGYYKIHN